jgi:hypothetical protein
MNEPVGHQRASRHPGDAQRQSVAGGVPARGGAWSAGQAGGAATQVPRRRPGGRAVDDGLVRKVGPAQGDHELPLVHPPRATPTPAGRGRDVVVVAVEPEPRVHRPRRRSEPLGPAVHGRTTAPTSVVVPPLPTSRPATTLGRAQRPARTSSLDAPTQQPTEQPSRAQPSRPRRASDALTGHPTVPG